MVGDVYKMHRYKLISHLSLYVQYIISKHLQAPLNTVGKIYKIVFKTTLT